jgi:crossover junction endodeoxyribonuclease RuvC
VNPNSKNSASLAAGRAPNSFCFAVEPSEHTTTAPGSHGAIIGIDPGIGGALALLSCDGDLVEVTDMPVLSDGSGGCGSVNAPLLAEVLARWHAWQVICEFVSARPKEGAVGAFSFGHSRRLIEGADAALSLPIRFIARSAWKRLAGLPAGRRGAKDAARSEAIGRWPDKAAWFVRKCDDCNAEAALIGVAGVVREAAR